MAKVTGYICDVCDKMFYIDNRPAPAIRIKVTITTVLDHKDESKDICSNLCLAEWSQNRLEAETDPT